MGSSCTSGAAKKSKTTSFTPKAIHRIIEAAVTSGKAPTLDAVRQEIEALIEELREDTTELIATEIQKRTRNRTSLAASMKEARSTVAEAWKTEEGRLGVVSGKELLAKIAALAKATYNACVTPERILRELRIDEIPDEMRAVIQAIELTAPLAS